jgi:hypothetical protein
VPGDGTLTLPELSFAALDPPPVVTALSYESWRPGVVVRVAVALALHAALAAWSARRAAPGRALADTRLAVLAAGPLLGGLAGLTVVVPAALAFDTTVEDREVARGLALDSFRDGATWGLVAGLLAGLALTVARSRAAPDPSADTDTDGDADEEARRLLRAAVAAGPAAAGTALALVLLLGSRTFAVGPYGPADPAEARRLLGYVHWALQPTGVTGYQPADYIPVFVLPPYLLAVLLLGALAGAVTVARPPALRVAAGWWAVTVSLALYAGFGAVLRTIALLQRLPDALGGSWSRMAVTAVNDVVAALPALAAYTALVGWLPAVAAAPD